MRYPRPRPTRPPPGLPLLWSLAAAAGVAAPACQAGQSSLLAALDSIPGEVVQQPLPDNGSPTSPDDQPSQTPTPDPPSAKLTEFKQGLYRGQDPRMVFANGSYYFTGFNGQDLTLYKSPSLVERGVGKNIEPIVGETLASPVFIDAVGGQKVGAWFMFGSLEVWRNPGTDPYDDAAKWQKSATLPWSDLGTISSVPFDFELFKNPQDGPYKDRWYLLYVRNDPQLGYAENVHITEITQLSANGVALSHTAASADNKLVGFHIGSWKDVIVEAPSVAVNGQSVTMAYSGNGAPTTGYALGLAALKPGADPLSPASWIDFGEGACDGVPAGPAFAKTDKVWGPGVSRFVPSADGKETWMVYHSKVFMTLDASGPAEPMQTAQERWTRQIMLGKVGWKSVRCGATELTVPDLGTPVPPGTAMPMPSGDPGPKAAKANRRFEAEGMIPFGTVMGRAIQMARTNSDTESVTAKCPACSSGSKIVNLDLLAEDVPTAPKRSGLTLRNLPPASGVVVGYAAVAAASLELTVNGDSVKTLDLPATGSSDTVKTVTAEVAIPLGSELGLMFEQGKSKPADLDFIELVPPAS